jgi:hypothetical protein
MSRLLVGCGSLPNLQLVCLLVMFRVQFRCSLLVAATCGLADADAEFVLYTKIYISLIY